MTPPRSGPPRNDSERMVWAAAYAAAWALLREFRRSHGGPQSDAGIARDAADEAWGALHELRAIAAGEDPNDFEDDARSVIDGAP